MPGPGLRLFGKGRRMTNRSHEADRFMEGLDHPLKDGIERLKAAILDSLLAAPPLRCSPAPRLVARSGNHAPPA